MKHSNAAEFHYHSIWGRITFRYPEIGFASPVDSWQIMAKRKKVGSKTGNNRTQKVSFSNEGAGSVPVPVSTSIAANEDKAKQETSVSPRKKTSKNKRASAENPKAMSGPPQVLVAESSAGKALPRQPSISTVVTELIVTSGDIGSVANQKSSEGLRPTSSAGSEYDTILFGVDPLLEECLREEEEQLNQAVVAIAMPIGQRSELPPLVAQDAAPGNLFKGGYQIKSVISTDSAGTLYLVEQQEQKAQFVIQTIAKPAPDASFLNRFRSEFRQVIELNHSSIVKVFSTDVSNLGIPFFVMESWQGIPLTDIVKMDSLLQIKVAFRIIRQLAEALAYAHGLNVLHYGLTPANIVMTQEAGAIRAKILNFGTAKALCSDDGPGYEDAKWADYLNPQYMSPEQCCAKPVDKRTDIYGLGCVFFELLTGAPPFAGKTAAQIFTMHETSSPPALKEKLASRDFPDWLESIVAKMLAKQLGDRYQSMEELLEDLKYVGRGESPTHAKIDLSGENSIEPKEDAPQTLRSGEDTSDGEQELPASPLNELRVLGKGQWLSPMDGEQNSDTEDSRDITQKIVLASRAGEFAIGDVLNDTYKILAPIGKGGMGQVFRVSHLGLNKEFALKTLIVADLDPASEKRFRMEIRAVSKLFHPNIVQVHNADMADMVPYYVMDLLDGETLSSYGKRANRVKIEDLCEIFTQVADGMAYAHRHGIVHRDIKPGNIVIVRDGRKLQAKIVDFGLAKFVGEVSTSEQLTKSGEVFGSTYYMSPEQGRGQKVDASSDIYSLGCTLFEALTGTPPFIGETPFQTIAMHQNERPPTLKQASLGREFPRKLEYIVAKLLQKEPARRYLSMEDFAKDLTNFLEGKELEFAFAPLPQKLEAKWEPKQLVEEFTPEQRANSMFYLILFVTIAVMASVLTYVFLAPILLHH